MYDDFGQYEKLTASLIECVQIAKTYRQGKILVHALQDINLRIEYGGFVALSGPSGSGKTTLLNIIGGLDRPDSGRILVKGLDYASQSPAQLAQLRLQHIGFIFQSFNLIPVLSAEENVEYVMLLQGVPGKERSKRARAILQEVGLSGMYTRRPAELSGGQQQRVAVARAMVSNPSLILADEPTANLDSQTGEGLLRMMRTMNASRQTTFIFSTHDKMVMDYANRVISMRDGKIVGDVVQNEEGLA
jgi:putative ABC transport system ATP-binding protein